MKFIFIFITLFASLSFANEQNGFYEVPRPDGQIINYQSKIEFQGDSLTHAEEFTVHFPKDLMGVENSFVIQKINDQWVGDEKLFDKLECGSSLAFDFVCEMHFNKEAIVDQTLEETKILINDDPQKLIFDRTLAEQSLVTSGLSPMAIDSHLISSDVFSNEPIGFLKYRADYSPLVVEE